MEEKGVATLDRALAILAAFSDDMPELTLAEMSRRTGIYKSTLLRLLTSLIQSGLVEQTEAGSYHIGAASMRLANLYRRSLNGWQVIGTALQKLVAATNENANFYVRRGNARVCIHSQDSPQRIRAHTLVGDIFPLERGAGGKILSAFSSDLGSADGMAAVRERCVAISVGEYAADLTAIAAPVFGAVTLVEGTVAITGPNNRLTPERLVEVEPLLLQTTIDLTQALGGDAAPLERALHRAEQRAAAQSAAKAHSGTAQAGETKAGKAPAGKVPAGKVPAGKKSPAASAATRRSAKAEAAPHR